MKSDEAVKTIRAAFKTWPKKFAPQEIKERVIIPEDNEIYDALMRIVFKGTDIEDLANYPKRTGRNTI